MSDNENEFLDKIIKEFSDFSEENKVKSMELKLKVNDTIVELAKLLSSLHQDERIIPRLVIFRRALDNMSLSVFQESCHILAVREYKNLKTTDSDESKG